MSSVGIVFLFVAVLFAAIIYFTHAAAQKRREAMAAYAASRGWTWVREDPSLVHAFEGMPFGEGHSRRATNVLRGQHDGRAMVAFDYEYQITSGSGEDRRTSTYRSSVIAMSAGAVFPELSVTPQNFLSGFVGRVFNQDIELESEDFNRAFVVTCPSRKFASDVLHPRMMETLLRWPDAGWRFTGESILAVRSGRHTPEEVDAKLDHLDAILDSIPEFVWRDISGRG